MSAVPAPEPETEIQIASGWDPFDVWRTRVRLGSAFGRAPQEEERRRECDPDHETT